MTIPRDVNFSYDQLIARRPFNEGNPVKDEMLAPTNSLLLGNVQRTSTVSGKTATVANGENIQVAIDNISKSGGGTVLVLPGSYVLQADLEIPSGVKVEGASRDGVLIDCNTNYAVKMNGVSVYSTGTITISEGDTTVVGSGTTWTEDMVGSYILLDDYYYEITAFNSATSIDIAEAFAGTDQSGDTYVIADPNFNPSIARVTIFNATGAGIECHNTSEPNFDDVFIYDCGTGIEIYESIFARILVSLLSNGINLDCYKMHGFKIDYSGFEDATDQGVIFDTCSGGTFFDSAAIANGGNGIELNDCRSIAFISTFFTANGDNGMEFLSNNSDIKIVASEISYNTNDGAVLTATTDRVSFSTTSVVQNGGYGINIVASTCDDNYIVAPTFSSNTSGNINDSGTNTVIVAASVYDMLDSVTAFEGITGATTPVPVAMIPDGTVLISDANSSFAPRKNFLGFVSETISGALPEIIGTPVESSGATTSYTVEPGNNLCLVVAVHAGDNSSAATLPSAYSWNGISLTQQTFAGDGALRIALWTAPLGDIASDTTADLVRTGGSGANGVVQHIFVYDKIDQSTPVDDAAASKGITNTSAVISPTQQYGRGFIHAAARITSANVTTSGVTDQITGSLQESSDLTSEGGFTASASANTGFDIAVAGCLLKTTTSEVVAVKYRGVQGGFSGLTPGSLYYVQDTIGTIGTSVGTTTIQVGVAVSTTEILIRT